MVSEFKLGGFAALVLAVVAAMPLAAQPAHEMDEYQVKAGFLTAFAGFIEWPNGAFAGPADPLAICVLGSDPFGPSLDTVVAGKVIGGRALAVRRISDVRRATGCHMVFVGASEHLRLRAVLTTLRDQCVLSVGDTSDFIAEGGIVNLRLENGKVRIDINEDAAKEVHLRVSSRLLQLARNVKR